MLCARGCSVLLVRLLPFFSGFLLAEGDALNVGGDFLLGETAGGIEVGPLENVFQVIAACADPYELFGVELFVSILVGLCEPLVWRLSRKFPPCHFFESFSKFRRIQSTAPGLIRFANASGPCFGE